MMDFTSMVRPLVLKSVLVALGVATVCAVALWRAGRYRQRKLQALGQEIEELRTENQRLAHTVSSVSHELVQPLGAISNYAEVIRRRSAGDVREYAASILEVSAKAARRIRESGAIPGPNGQPAEPRAEGMSEGVEVVEPSFDRETAAIDSWASSTHVTAGSERPL